MTPLAAFQPYGTSHWLVLGLFVVGLVPLVAIGRRVSGTAAEVPARRGLAIALVATTVPLQVVDLLPGYFRLHATLPLHLCDLAWPVAAYALWTRRPWAVTVAYLWGLLLTPQAMLTPTLDDDFAHPRFFAYWAMHLLIVYAAVFLVWGLRVRPTWRGFRVTVVLTSLWATVVFLFNLAAGTNYGYLNRKPDTATLLDLLGPWPVYVLVEVALVVVAWALMVWPWTRPGRRGDRAA